MNEGGEEEEDAKAQDYIIVSTLYLMILHHLRKYLMLVGEINNNNSCP